MSNNSAFQNDNQISVVEVGDGSAIALAAKSAAETAATNAANSATQALSASQTSTANATTSTNAANTATMAATQAASSANAANLAAQNIGGLAFPTVAAMNADLAHAANTICLVTNDTTSSNNGQYIKLGASGTGSWQKSSYIPPVADNSVATASIQNSAVTPDKIKYLGLQRNCGTVYPLIAIVNASITSPTDDNFVNNGILDIKVFNAIPGKLYKLEYIANSDPTYGDLILVNEYNADHSLSRTLFPTSKTTISNKNATGISKILIQSPTYPEITLSLIIDYSQMSGTYWICSQSIYRYYDSWIATDCYVYSKPISHPKYSQLMRKKGDNIIIASKYNNSNDLWITFDRGGCSNLLQISTMYLAANTGVNVHPDLDRTATVLGAQAYTDWVGPYWVKANQNASNSFTTPRFTGGWHGYNGDQTGTRTARTDNYTVWADGVQVDDNDSIIECDQVDIEVVNYIQAWNTIQSDGSGREVLCEVVHYAIRNGVIDVTVETAALESVTIQKYYGMQTINMGYDGPIHFVNGQQQGRVAFNGTELGSGAISSYPVERMCLRSQDGSNNLIAWLDRSFGIATGANVSPAANSAFVEVHDKSYFNIINGIDKVMEAGDVIDWSGRYIFTPGIFTPSSVTDLAFIYPDNDNLNLVIDYLNSGVRYCKTPPTQINRPVTIVNKSSTVTLVSTRVTPAGVKTSATGYGSATIKI